MSLSLRSRLSALLSERTARDEVTTPEDALQALGLPSADRDVVRSALKALVHRGDAMSVPVTDSHQGETRGYRWTGRKEEPFCHVEVDFLDRNRERLQLRLPGTAEEHVRALEASKSPWWCWTTELGFRRAVPVALIAQITFQDPIKTKTTPEETP